MMPVIVNVHDFCCGAAPLEDDYGELSFSSLGASVLPEVDGALSFLRDLRERVEHRDAADQIRRELLVHPGAHEQRVHAAADRHEDVRVDTVADEERARRVQPALRADPRAKGRVRLPEHQRLCAVPRAGVDRYTAVGFWGVHAM